MTNREFDVLTIGFAVGALTFLWLGYRLRARVERWHARGREKALAARRAARSSPFGDLSGSFPLAQSVRRVLADRPPASKFQRIPLMRRGPHGVPGELPSGSEVADAQPEVGREVDARTSVEEAGYLALSADDRRRQGAETAAAIRKDAVAVLVGAGYKRPVAEAALDACSLVERAGGFESWVAAAFRNAASARKVTAP